MLQTEAEPSLAKLGVDTAENGLQKGLQRAPFKSPQWSEDNGWRVSGSALLMRYIDDDAQMKELIAHESSDLGSQLYRQPYTAASRALMCSQLMVRNDKPALQSATPAVLQAL